MISRWMEFLQYPPASLRPRRLHPAGGLRTTTPEDRASDLARPSARSTGAGRRVKQDPGGMTGHPEYILTPLPACPRNRDQLTLRSERVNDER